jgi:K+-sensing histidine kinase KdpD
MDTLPSQIEDKVENRRNGTSFPQPLEATADIMGRDLKYPPRRVKRGILSTSQRGKEYGIAIGTTLLAFLLRLSLNSYLEDRLAYAMFLVAIAVTTWYGGIGPSLVAVVLGGLIANWVFIHPSYALSFTDLEDQAGIAVYLTVSYALVGFAQTWRWAWRKTEEMTYELRMEMERSRRSEEESTYSGSRESIPTSQREHRL